MRRGAVAAAAAGFVVGEARWAAAAAAVVAAARRGVLCACTVVGAQGGGLRPARPCPSRIPATPAALLVFSPPLPSPRGDGAMGRVASRSTPFAAPWLGAAVSTAAAAAAAAAVRFRWLRICGTTPCFALVVSHRRIAPPSQRLPCRRRGARVSVWGDSDCLPGRLRMSGIGAVAVLLHGAATRRWCCAAASDPRWPGAVAAACQAGGPAAVCPWAATRWQSDRRQRV